jgi:hypothetical protein
MRTDDYLDAVRKPFQGVAMKKKTASVVVLVCLLTLHFRVAAQQTPDWGSGVAPFAFALIGDMPYGTAGKAVRKARRSATST